MVYARDSASLKLSSAQREAVRFSERVAPTPLHVPERDLSLTGPRRLCLNPLPLRHPSRIHRASFRCLPLWRALPWNTSPRNGPEISLQKFNASVKILRHTNFSVIWQIWHLIGSGLIRIQCGSCTKDH